MFPTLQIIALFFLDSISNEINYNEKIKYPKPVYAKVQYAGNIGIASCGIGTYLLKDKLSVDFNYGYLPGSDNASDVNTLALKPAYQIGGFTNNRFRWGLYSGVCVTYSIANNTYIKYPEHYPDSYYMSNAFHFNPFFGLKIIPRRNGPVNAHSLYAELGTVDYKIWYAMSNKNIRVSEILNVCFGITIPLSRQ